MTIKIVCECGQRFKAKESHAGKTLKCPSCGRPLEIPLVFLDDDAPVVVPPKDAGEEYHLAPESAEPEEAPQPLACLHCGAELTPGVPCACVEAVRAVPHWPIKTLGVAEAWRMAAQMAKAPAGKIAELCAAPRLATIHGRIVAAPETAESGISGTECVYYEFNLLAKTGAIDGSTLDGQPASSLHQGVNKWLGRLQPVRVVATMWSAATIAVDDGTGVVQVPLRQAVVALPPSRPLKPSAQACEELLRHGYEIHLEKRKLARVTESLLKVGDRVFVVGVVSGGQDQAQMDAQALLVVSNVSGKQLAKRLRQRGERLIVAVGLVVVAIIAALALWLNF